MTTFTGTTAKYIPDVPGATVVETLTITAADGSTDTETKSYVVGANPARLTQPAALVVTRTGTVVAWTAPALGSAAILRVYRQQGTADPVQIAEGTALTGTDSPPLRDTVYTYSHRVGDAGSPRSWSLPSDPQSMSVPSSFVPDAKDLIVPFAVAPEPLIVTRQGLVTETGGRLELRVDAATSVRTSLARTGPQQGTQVALVAGDIVLAGMASGTGILTDSFVLNFSTTTRAVIQRYVDSITTPGTVVDQLRARLVENGVDVAQIVLDTPKTAGVPTPKALKLALLTDGRTVSYSYSEDYTEATKDTALFKPLAMRSFAAQWWGTSALTFTVERNLTLVSGSGTAQVSVTGVEHGTTRVTGGVAAPGDFARAFAAGDYLIGTLPGGATGQTAPIPKAGFTPVVQEIVSGSGATTVTVPTHAAGDYAIFYVASNQGNSSNSTGILVENMTTNGWLKLAEGVHGDGWVAAFGKKLVTTEPTITLSVQNTAIDPAGAAANLAVLKTLWTGQDPTSPVIDAKAFASGAASLSHPSTAVSAPTTDKNLLVAFDFFDGPAGQPTNALTAPTIGVTAMTKDFDASTSDANSDLRLGVAHLAVDQGTFAPTWTSSVNDQPVTINVLLRAAPGSGGTGGAAGIGEPYCVVAIVKKTSDGRRAVAGLAPDNTGTPGRMFLIDNLAGNTATPGWLIQRDQQQGTEGGNGNVSIANLTGYELCVWQKDAAGLIRTSIMRYADKTWRHSNAQIGPFQSFAAIPAAGRFYVGLPYQGAASSLGFVGNVAAVGWSKKNLTIPEIEAMVTGDFIGTMWRMRYSLTAGVNQGGATEEAHLWDTTPAAGPFTDQIGTIPLAIGSGTTRATDTGNVPFATGVDEGPPTTQTIGDPQGLVVVGTPTVNATDATLLDVRVAIDPPSAADLAQAGYTLVFYRFDAPSSQYVPIGTATTVPTTTSPKLLQVPIVATPVTIVVRARSNVATSDLSEPVIADAPPTVIVYHEVTFQPVAIVGGFRVTWDPVPEEIIEYHVHYRMRNPDGSYPVSYTLAYAGAGVATADGKLTTPGPITGLPTGHYQVHVDAAHTV